MFGGSSSLTVETILYHFLPQDASFLPRVFTFGTKQKPAQNGFPFCAGLLALWFPSG